MTDTIMTILFPYLDFIPFAIPRYLMFQNKLRIPFKYIMFLLFAVATVNSLTFYYINAQGYDMAMRWTTVMRYGFMLINLILSFTLIKDSFSKLMFTYLLLFSWSFFVFGNANYIESKFFWIFSDEHPYLIYNICRIIIYLITCPFMLRFFNHTVYEAMQIQDSDLWRHLWKIPLFSTLFGMLYCFSDDIYAYATWEFLISRYLMLFGTCYVSYVALKVLEVSKKRTQLQEALKYADQSIEAQKKQFNSLADHMDEMRKARHDVRQHLAVISSYIDKDDKEGLRTYIEMYHRELPPDVMELYSRNDVINAIICYYAGISREHGIFFDAKVDYPEGCSITETDMTVLIGNMLENAVEACQRSIDSTPFIKLRIRCHGSNELLVLTDNSCLDRIQFQDGKPLSSKRNGVGIGTVSIQDIARRYHGSARFEYREHVFYTSVIMHYEQRKSIQKQVAAQEYVQNDTIQSKAAA